MNNNPETIDDPDLSIEDRADALVRWFNDHRRVVVAFSGGVDSSVVLAAALRSDAEFVLAVTARSPSLAGWQLEIAKSVADQLGADHEIVDTDEINLPAYTANDTRRCFHCKSTLYGSLHQLIQAFNGVTQYNTIVSGTNADDLGDYRPGIAAGREAGVRTPLADLGIGKAVVREIAREFGLANSDLPASPCLASRIAYGIEVTPERLDRIERAESFLRSHGLVDLRVRLHEGELARIEVSANDIARLAEGDVRNLITESFRKLGFRYVTLDLQGLSSGSMNRPIVSLSVSNQES